MTSTPLERRHRAMGVMCQLIGSRVVSWRKLLLSTKRPESLPKGINFTAKEWLLIHDVAGEIFDGTDISILEIFDLEEMVEKYSPHLMLAKLEK